MNITRTSIFTGVTRTMELDITDVQLWNYEAGMLVQDAFPDLTADEREFFLTGMTAKEWDEFADMYGEED